MWPAALSLPYSSAVIALVLGRMRRMEMIVADQESLVVGAVFRGHARDELLRA